tara:strand:- start:260 stop:1489 length:1230 start_codon:yes stop_codon:yes gene_type:complete
MYNLRIFILKYLNLLGLKLDLPILSFIAINYSRSLLKNFGYKKKFKKKTIFIWYKSRGVNDIIEAFKGKKIDYKIFILSRIFFRDIYYFFFKKKPINFKKKNFLDIKNNSKYKNYIEKINHYFGNKYNNVLFITFNFQYFEMLGPSIFKDENKIKYYCLLKENNYSPIQKKIHFNNFKKIFNNFNFYHKMTVYNEDVKNNMIANKLIDKEKIYSIGFPRIIKTKKKLNTKKTILYFTIHPKGGIGLTNHKKNWNNLIEKTEKFLISYMKKNPSVNLIIKSKVGNYSQRLDNISKKISNIEYIHTGDAQNYLSKSDIVIGFNSSSIYESIYNNKRVLIPMLNFKNEDMKYSFEYPSSLICKDIKTFKQKLDHALKHKFNNKKKISHKKIIKKYLGDPEKAKQNLFKILNN